MRILEANLVAREVIEFHVSAATMWQDGMLPGYEGPNSYGSLDLMTIVSDKRAIDNLQNLLDEIPDVEEQQRQQRVTAKPRPPSFSPSFPRGSAASASTAPFPPHAAAATAGARCEATSISDTTCQGRGRAQRGEAHHG